MTTNGVTGMYNRILLLDVVVQASLEPSFFGVVSGGYMNGCLWCLQLKGG